MPTIPRERRVITDFLVSRPDGQTWVNLTGYANEFEVQLGSIEDVGTGNTGGDSVVRQLSCNIYNDMVYMPTWDDQVAREETEIVGDDADIIGQDTDGAEKLINLLFDTDNGLSGDILNPKDRKSLWNQFDADGDGIPEYNPLLYPTREVELRVAIYEDGPEGLYNQELGTTQIIQEVLGTGDGNSRTFRCNRWPVYPQHVQFFVNGIISENYTIDYDTGEVTTTATGECTINYIYYHPLFAGYMGDSIKTDEDGVTALLCRDYSMRLMAKAITEEKKFTYENGKDAELVIQEILDYYFGPGEIELYCPVSPGFSITEVNLKDESVFDATQKIATQFGWFLGYLYDANTNQWRYTLLEPPRTKDASTADYYITARDDIFKSDLDITSRDVRNKIIVPYTDSNGDIQTVTVYDQGSIDEFWEKPMRINMADSIFIDTAQEATDFGNAALHDLKDLSAESIIIMPIIPQVDLFTGFVLDNPLLSSTIDFYGVQSVRHTINISDNSWDSDLITEAVCASKVIGSHRKWLDMESRPGASPPIDEIEIPGTSIGAPTNIVVTDSGTVQVEDVSMAYAVLSWTAPSGYQPQYYVIQMQVAGEDWSSYQEFLSRSTIQKIIFAQGVAYEVRIAGFSKVNKMGDLSEVVQISEVTNGNAPITPIFDDINCYFDDVIYLKWLDNNDRLPIIYEVREDLNWGDGNHLYQGKNTNLIIEDLDELSNPTLPTQTFYIKALSYNDVYSGAYDSVTVINSVPAAPTGFVITSSLSQLHLAVSNPNIADLKYVEYEVYGNSDYSDPPDTYKRKEFEITVPTKTDGINYCRVRFVDILGQESGWTTNSTDASLITRQDMQGAIFQINPTSTIEPASGDLKELWNSDTASGPTFNVPDGQDITITFEFPMQWFFSLVRFYTGSAEGYYVEVYNDSTDSWIEILGSATTPKTSNANGWTIEKFEGLTTGKMYVSQKARITFVDPGSFSITALKFWTVTLADEILAGILYLTGNMKIVNENGSVEITSTSINIDGSPGANQDYVKAETYQKLLENLRDAKEGLDSHYANVYGNPDLTSALIKDALSAAKTSYDTAYSDLVSSINAAIADNKITSAEQTDIDNLYDAYRIELSGLIIALEDALDNIAQSKADEAKNYADSLWDALGDMALEDAVEIAKLGSTIIEGGYFKTGLVHAGRIDAGTLNADLVNITAGNGSLQMGGSYAILANDGEKDTLRIGIDGSAFFEGELGTKIKVGGQTGISEWEITTQAGTEICYENINSRDYTDITVHPPDAYRSKAVYYPEDGDNDIEVYTYSETGVGNYTKNFTTPSSTIRGLYSDGTYLWAINAGGRMYKFFPANFSSIDVIGYWDTGIPYTCEAITMDSEGYLWVATHDNDIYKLDTSGNILGSYNISVTSKRGLEYADGYFFVATCTSNFTSNLYIYSENFTLIKTLSPPHSIVHGLHYEKDRKQMNMVYSSNDYSRFYPFSKATFVGYLA